MKAYKVWDEKAEENYCDVVFAESANKARQSAVGRGSCEWADYIDIRAKRLPLLDKLYKGKTYGDWYDMELRKVLVEQYGWTCIEPDRAECERCKLCEDWADEDLI